MSATPSKAQVDGQAAKANATSARMASILASKTTAGRFETALVDPTGTAGAKLVALFTTGKPVAADFDGLAQGVLLAGAKADVASRVGAYLWTAAGRTVATYCKATGLSTGGASKRVIVGRILTEYGCPDALTLPQLVSGVSNRTGAFTEILDAAKAAGTPAPEVTKALTGAVAASLKAKADSAKAKAKAEAEAAKAGDGAETAAANGTTVPLAPAGAKDGSTVVAFVAAASLVVSNVGTMSPPEWLAVVEAAQSVVDAVKAAMPAKA